MATILVTDDRTLNREFLAMLLGHAGHSVVEATNGREALERVRAVQPQLVISDIAMPSMDGIEFANRMHADPALRHIPIIFYTATYRNVDARKLALSCGVGTVIPKPSRPQVILEAVAAALRTSLPADVPRPAREPSTTGGEAPAEQPAATESDGPGLRLATLSEVALELSAELDPQRLLDVATRAAAAVFDARFAVLGTLDGQAGILSHFAVSGFPESMRPVFAMLEPKVFLGTGEPRRLNDPAAAAALLPAWHPRVRTLMTVPLRSTRRTVGWLYVADRSGRGEPFTDDDEQVAVTLATVIAQNYENLRLYSESSAYSFQLEAETSERKRAEHAWMLSEEHLRNILDHAPIGMAVTAINGKFIRVNRVLCEIFGRSRSDLKHRTLQEILDVDASRGLPFVPGLVDDGVESPREVELRCRRQSTGERIWVSVTASSLRSREGEPFQYIVQVQDITARKKAEDDLRLAASVFDNTLDGIWIADTNGLIVSVNPAFTAITGYPPEEAIGVKPPLMSGEQAAPDFCDQLCEMLRRDGRWVGELWSRRKNGEAFLQWLSVTVVPGADGLPARYVGVFDDITEMRRKDEHIHYLAFHDPLTGLPNRTLLHDRLEHSIAAAARENLGLAVMFIDVDRFKVINDSLGHHVGDSLLQEVAGRIKHSVRQSDTVARVGGDEFVVILEHPRDPADYGNVAQKVIAALSQPLVIAGHRLQVGASVGIATFPGDGNDAGNLMKNADAAMYVAKAAGRGTYRFFHPTMNEGALQRLQLEADLRSALANGEFELHYQPTVTLGTDAARRVEAMLRWRHPARGLVMPSEFIPLAEETGIIGEIGDWVIEEACRQSSDWRARGIGPMRIAVTVAARQLQQGDLADRIRDLAWQYDILPSDLEIKLTERTILANRELIEGMIGRLRDVGVVLAVDDFGTESSTLAYLRRLPIDSLSIDRSFVMNAEHDEKDAQIVRSILALGESLKLEVVAEGVETESQANFLKASGCTLGQGYFYAHPAPAARIEVWLRGHAGPAPAGSRQHVG